MISKFYELAKFKNKINYYLFYGENDGQKLDTIETNFKIFTKENTYKYSEKGLKESKIYSTVTDLAKFLGWSTWQPLITAMWYEISCKGIVVRIGLKRSSTSGISIM